MADSSSLLADDTRVIDEGNVPTRGVCADVEAYADDDRGSGEDNHSTFDEIHCPILMLLAGLIFP